MCPIVLFGLMVHCLRETVLNLEELSLLKKRAIFQSKIAYFNSKKLSPGIHIANTVVQFIQVNLLSMLLLVTFQAIEPPKVE